MTGAPDPDIDAPVDIPTELAALDRARDATKVKLAKLSTIDNEAADEYSAAFMDHMVGVTIDKLRQELDNKAFEIGQLKRDLQNAQTAPRAGAGSAGGQTLLPPAA